MKESDIHEELKNVVIEYHLEFWYNGEYEFRRSEYCDGPMLGHLKPKCPKVEYSEKDVQRFEKHIKNIGGFKEAIWEREKRLRERAVKLRVENLTEVLGEEQIVKMKDMTESEIEEVIKMVVNSEEEMKLIKEVFKVILEKEERVEMENMKEESKTEEEEEVIVDENYMNFGSSSMMLIASGVKKSVISREWIRE